MRTGAALAALASLGSGLLVLTACQSPGDPGAAQTAEAFYAALASRDGAAACAAMTPTTRTELEQSSGKSCAEAVLAEDLPMPNGAGSTRVFGTMAIVTSAHETAFLTRFPDGWLVTAAGCTSPGNADQYDCKVKGG